MGWVDIAARPRPEGWNREKGRGGRKEDWDGKARSSSSAVERARY